MKEKTKYVLIGIVIGGALMALVYIYLAIMDYAAVDIFSLKDECSVMLKQTCDTTNSVINLSNKQGELLEKCYDTTMPRLSYIGCNKIP